MLRNPKLYYSVARLRQSGVYSSVTPSPLASARFVAASAKARRRSMLRERFSLAFRAFSMYRCRHWASLSPLSGVGGLFSPQPSKDRLSAPASNATRTYTGYADQ